MVIHSYCDNNCRRMSKAGYRRMEFTLILSAGPPNKSISVYINEQFDIVDRKHRMFKCFNRLSNIEFK